MSEINVGLRLTANASGYVPPVQEARAETEKLGQALKDASAPTAGLADAMKNAAPATEGLIGAMGRSVSAGALLGTGLVAVGVAALATAGYIGNMVRATIESNAQLANFAEQSGLSVEALSALKDVAAITGVSFDKVVAAGSNLAKSMFKGVEAFDTLGIAVKNSDGTLRSQDEVLLAVARSFAGMEDGAAKTALAQQIFGRSGSELISVLNELGAAGEYNVTVTGRQAQLADDMGKAWVRLTKTTDDLWQSFANALTPSLTALAKGLVEAANQTGGLRDTLASLVNKGEVAAWAQKAAVWVGELIDAMVNYRAQALAAIDITKLSGSAFAGFGTILSGVSKIMWGQLSGGLADLKKGWTDLKQAGTDLNSVFSNLAPSHAYRDAIVGQVLAIQTNTEEQKKNTTAVNDGKTAHAEAKVKIADYRSEIARLDAQLLAVNASYDGGSTKLSNYAKAQLRVQEDIDAGKKTIDAQVDALLASAKALDDGEEAAKKYAAAQKENTKEADLLRQAFEKADAVNAKRLADFEKLKDAGAAHIASLKDEIAMIGISVPEQILYTAELEKQALAKQNLTDAERATLAAQIDTTAQLKIQKVQAQDTYAAWKAAIESVQNLAYNFILDVVEKDWKTAFKNLWSSFKQMALQAFAQISAQKIAVSLAGTFGLTGGAGANGLTGGAAGGGGIFDSLVSAGTSLASSFSGIGMAVADFSQLLGQGVGIVDAFGMATSAAGLTLGSIVPVVGGIVAAGTLLYNFLDSKKGGPKSGGFAASGDTAGISGTDNGGRWFTPNQDDQQIQAFVDGLQTTFDGFIGALGLKFDAAFALGYDTDPDGTASNRLHAGVFGAAGQIYDQQMSDLGRDPAQLDAALQAAAKSSLLTAFAAAGVPEAITAYLDSIPFEHFEAALNDIGAAIAALDRLDTKKIFGELVDFDALAGLRQQGESFSQTLVRLSGVFLSTNAVAIALGKDATTAFGEVGLASLAARENLIELSGGIDALTSATNFYVEHFYSDSRKLGMAQDSLGEAFADLQAQFPDLLTSIPQTKAEFVKLVDGLDLSTEAGRQAYAALMKIAPTFDYVAEASNAAQEQMAKDAQAYADEMKRIADQLRADAQSLGSLQIQLAGGSGDDVTRYQRNASIDQFAMGRDWAQSALQSGGYDSFAKLLSGITQEDFANYSAADRQTILGILGAQNQLQGQQGSGGGSYGGGGSSYADMRAPPVPDGVADSQQALADATLHLYDALARDPRAEALQALTNTQVSQMDVVQGLGARLADLSAAYDGSSAKAVELATATNAYIDAQVALLIQIGQLKASIDDMFTSSIESIVWSQLSNDERRAKLMAEQANAMKELAGTTDTGKIKELSKLINDDLVKAFNLLSPEEQKKQQDSYIKALDAANDLSQQQLDLASDAVEDAEASAQTILTGINTATERQVEAADLFMKAATASGAAADLFAKAVAAQEAAAAVIAQAAGTMNTAANTPVTVVNGDPGP